LCVLSPSISRAYFSYADINEALGRNFATPDDIDEADLDAELEMLGDELEEDVGELEATPSYLLPATPADTIGGKDTETVFDLPSAPLANH
jgi:charged multivesicular body protein 5